MSAASRAQTERLLAWKGRAEKAEAKLEEYARRQDEMAAQSERLRERLREERVSRDADR